MIIRRLFLLGAISLLSACSTVIFEERDSAPDYPPSSSSHVPDAIPRHEKPRAANQRPYTVFGKRYYPMKSADGFKQRGIASWYGKKFHGRKTANGETYNMYAMTAAHKRLPLPTYVHIRNLENGRIAVVRVNDRGPFHGDRIIDLSYSAARKIGMLRKGTAMVEINVVRPGDSGPTASVPPPEPKPSTTAEQRPSAKPSKLPERFSVQVGAFSQYDNARRLRDNLSTELGKPVRIMQSKSSEQTLYRVLIGPMDTLDVVENVIQQLPALGIQQKRIISE